MNRSIAFAFALALTATIAVGAQSARHVSAATTDVVPDIRDAAASISWSEKATEHNLGKLRPRGEIYLQEFAPASSGGWLPRADWHFIGDLIYARGPRMEQIPPPQNGQVSAKRRREMQRLLDAFAEFVVVDWNRLDPRQYEFTFAGKEKIGNIVCLVYDVRPVGSAAPGYEGRLWVEPRERNVIRLNGRNRRLDRALAEFFGKPSQWRVDSWRVNVSPGVWMPYSTWIEETGRVPNQPVSVINGFMRVWGYESAASPDGTAEMHVNSIPDGGLSIPALQPLNPERSNDRWQFEAERNLLERLTRGKFLAPPGEVEQQLERIVRSLLAANRLVLDRPVECRILNSWPLEASVWGNTLILSIGTLDVAPGTATVAAIIAHQLSHLVLQHARIDTRWAFVDVLRIPDSQLLDLVRFRYTPEQEAAADEMTVRILSNSPYRDEMPEAGLFMQAINAHADRLDDLLTAQLGEHLVDRTQVIRRSRLLRGTQAYVGDRPGQTAALALGSRLSIDAVTGRVSMFQAETSADGARKPAPPLSVGPLIPFMRYVDEPITSSGTDSPSAAGSPLD